MIDLVKLHQAATHAQVEGYLLKWNGSEIRQLVDQLLAAKKDAARWNRAIMYIGADNILGGAQYVIRGIPAPVNVMNGSVSEHFTNSIDAAMAATKGEQA